MRGAWGSTRPAALEPDEPLVVYCAGRTCDEALVLGRQLRDAGYTGVSVYVGGYDAWRRAGHEIERDTSERKDL